MERFGQRRGASKVSGAYHRATPARFRDPESQPIENIGLRPGEKLHEELFYDRELAEPTSAPKVMRIDASLPP